MNCINCGKETRSEYNNCPYCGKPLQIVPDYTIYDDDDINVLLEGAKDVESKNNKAYIKAQKEKEKQEAFENKKQQQTKKTILYVLIVCIALIVIAIIAKIVINVNNASSYDYQMKMADNAMFKQDLDSAEAYYLKALELAPDDIDVRLELSDLYIKKEDNKEAEKFLKEVIALDPANERAYKILLAIYEESMDVHAVLELMKGVTDAKILALFSDYSVDSPNVGLEAGTYSEKISIGISADAGLKIFYTLDGSDPISNGKLYTSNISINDAGMHTLKVVAKNDYDIYSEVVTVTYVIEFEAPSDPIVTPDGGEFTSKQTVSIHVPAGCSAYYTWDGSSPTVMSTLYVGPIEIPEGYNILSVIIINDETGLESGIYRGAFEYIPN